MLVYTHIPRACIVSIVRAFYVEQFKGPDPTCTLFRPMGVLQSLHTDPEHLGDDVNTVELSGVELGVGIFTACLPAYKPLYNLCFPGESTRTGINGGSTANIKTSDTQRSIKMSDISRGWYRNRQALGSDVEDLNAIFAVTPDTKDQENHRASIEPRHGILVTREFTTESTLSR